MANKEYTINRFGKKVRYRKVGSKYFRVKADGTLAKDAATGLILANLKNATGSSIVSSPDKMLATVRSAVAGTNKKGQMGRIRTAMASDKTTKKEDLAKAKLDFATDIRKVKKPAKSNNVIKKDTSIKTDSKPVTKKKDTTPLKKVETKKISTTKTKALQNMPTKQDKKTETKKETKKEAPKRSKGFLDRVKEDFKKAVKETKRNIQGDIKKGTGRYKSVNESDLDSKGNYKGTNIKPTKLQLSRMKKEKMMKGGYSTKKKMMGGGYAMKKKKK